MKTHCCLENLGLFSVTELLALVISAALRLIHLTTSVAAFLYRLCLLPVPARAIIASHNNISLDM